MIQKKTIKLFGVAGAGKTTECLNYVKKFLNEGYDIDDICFTTFTRAGILSICEKLEKEGIILPKEHNFKTLNSLTWRLSGFNPSQMITLTDKKAFFTDIMVMTESEEEDEKPEMDIVVELYNNLLNTHGLVLEKISKNDILKYINYYWNEYDIKMDKEKAIDSIFKYNQWKNENDKKDYVDSIIFVLTQKIDIPYKILFVDEAQDLSISQTMLIDLWTKEYDKEYFIICGDDDQTVHEWAGAKPNYLIEYKNDNLEIKKLEKTYRLPKNISDFCNMILKRIYYREQKTLFSSKSNGRLGYLHINIYELPILIEKMKDKKVFLLFRTNKICQHISDVLFDSINVPFGKINNKDTKWSKKFICISNALNKIDKKVNLYKDEVEYLFESLPSITTLKHGSKKLVRDSPKREFTVTEVLEYTKLWSTQKVLSTTYKNDKTKNEMIKYINYYKGSNDKVMLKNDLYRKKLCDISEIYKITFDDDKNLIIDYNIKVGTFHMSKGLEADEVFVFLGTSHFFSEIDDSEKRCFYVACSRAKQNLYIISSYGFDGQQDYLEQEFKHLLESIEK